MALTTDERFDRLDQRLDRVGVDLRALGEQFSSHFENAQRELKGELKEINKDLLTRIEGTNRDLLGRIETVNDRLIERFEKVLRELTGELKEINKDLLGRIETVNVNLTDKVNSSLNESREWERNIAAETAQVYPQPIHIDLYSSFYLSYILDLLRRIVLRGHPKAG
jgi:hypothetical protein